MSCVEVSNEGYQDSKAAVAFAELVQKDGFSKSMFADMETNSLQRALGMLGISSLKGLNVLDVGCGEGRLCRKFTSLGAVCFGCDSSKDMIDQAKASSGEGGDVAESYFVLDIGKPGAVLPEPLTTKQFDVAICIYVLQMASDIDVLKNMCSFLAKHTKKAVVISVSGEYVPNDRQTELMGKVLGFTSVREPMTENQIRFTMSDTYSVINFQHSEIDYMTTLLQAGFSSVDTLPVTVTEEFRNHTNKTGNAEIIELIERYVANPHVKTFVCGAK